MTHASKYDNNFVRDVSEKVYRLVLRRDCGKDAVERMLANDGDGGTKLRNRAASYDKLTRVYLEALGSPR